MNAVKSLLVIVAVAVASVSLTGCGTLEHSRNLRDSNPGAYEAMTGEANYSAQNPQFNVHGS